MKTRRTKHGHLVIVGGAMDGVLIHEGNISVIGMLPLTAKVKQM